MCSEKWRTFLAIANWPPRPGTFRPRVEFVQRMWFRDFGEKLKPLISQGLFPMGKHSLPT